jgi:hypothetical protein
MKEPFGQGVWASLLTIAPPHSACFPSTTFGFILKVLSHKPKCGGVRRKASHMTMNAEM